MRKTGFALVQSMVQAENRRQSEIWQTPYYFVALLFVLLLTSWKGACADEDGLDLFVKACQYQGHNPPMIFSGYAEMQVTSRVVPEKISDQVKKDFIENAKKRITDSNELKKVLDGIEAEIEYINRGNDSLRRKKILFLGNESGSGWRRFEFFSKQGNADANIFGFRYGNGNSIAGNAISVLRTPLSRNTTLDNHFIYIDEFKKFGRLQGLPSTTATLMLLDGTSPEKFRFPPSGIEKFKNMTREVSEKNSSIQLFTIKEEVLYDSNRSTATVLESTYKGKITQRYWIDASRGYVCPKIQIYDLLTGDLLEEYISTDYFFHKPSGLWFPQKYTEIRKNAATKKILENCDYVIDPETFWLNQKVALKEFVIDVPEGESIIDNRNNLGNIVYRSISPGALSINDVNKLEELDWLEKVNRGQHEIRRSERMNGFRLICISLGIVMIVLALFKKFLDNKTKTMMILVFLLTFLGCSSSTEVKPLVLLTPETLDFGNVRLEDSPVTREFSVMNNSDLPLEILDVRSGCGCTVLELPSHLISPHDSCTIPVKVDFSGRSGAFSNLISIKTSLTQEPLLVNLKGKVVRDIWLSNNTLRCMVESTNGNHATGTFEVKTVNYPDIAFDTNACGEGFIVQELCRENIGDETVIKFRVNVDDTTNKSKINQLELTPKNSNIKPLTLHIVRLSKDEGISISPVHTVQVNIHQITPREQYRVFIEGEPDFLDTVSGISLVDAPSTLSVEICEAEKQSGTLGLLFSVEDNASQELIDGQIVLKRTNGDLYYISMFGKIEAIENVSLLAQPISSTAVVQEISSDLKTPNSEPDSGKIDPKKERVR